MVRYAAAHVSAANPDKFAMSRGEYLPTHFKNMREVAAALTGMNLQTAFTYLADVKEHKQVIPFRRFAGGIGRASQAKQFKTTKGRWPEKSVRHILNLLKNAESNADAKDLDKEELVIKNINVNQAPVSPNLQSSLGIITDPLNDNVENPTKDLPSPRSNQPLPGSPLSR
jgi:large subunit ribosomal protein L17e